MKLTVAIGVLGMAMIASSVVLAEEARSESEQTEPARVRAEVGGWKIAADAMKTDDEVTTFEGTTVAARGPWRVTADRLTVDASRDSSTTWTAVGEVRLIGPDDIYVTGSMASLEGDRWEFPNSMGSTAKPSVIRRGWRLWAENVNVEMQSRRVTLQKVGRAGNHDLHDSHR